MKKRILALSLAVATVITVLAVGIFATNVLRSSNTQPTDAATDPVVVAGYTDGTNITIGKNLYGLGKMLDDSENWVLPGRLVDSEGNVTGSFGVQWSWSGDMKTSYLYLAVQRLNSTPTIYLSVNDTDAINVSTIASASSLNNAIAELKIPLSEFNLGTINGYNNEFPIKLSLSTGGSFSGTLRLSSVQWWKTSNPDQSVSTSITKYGKDGNETSSSALGGSSATNSLNLFNQYSSGTTIGTRTEATYATYDEMATRDNTVYVAFDFNATSMPVYHLAEALGGNFAEPYYSNYGFSWQLADGQIEYTLEDGSTYYCSNVSMGGIVNTEDGLYLVIAGRHYNTLRLGKNEDETFNVGLAWHKNGDLSVYIDGVLQAYYTGTTKYMMWTNRLVSEGIRFICYRDNAVNAGPEGDYNINISNLAFGSGQPDAPVKALEFENIRNNNNSSAEAVTDDLSLPTTLGESYLQFGNIVWTSSNIDVISDIGVVTRPDTGAIKVTLTATDAVGNQKSIDVVVLGGTTSNSNVLVVRGDKNPAVGQADTYDSVTYGDVFHFDSNNNSLVYDQETAKRVNMIKLTDLDNVSRLNRETISIWTSNDNVTYTRVEGDYKLLHIGNEWYLYNFDVTARYIKVNYTMSDELYTSDMDSLDDIQMNITRVMYDAPESDFANVLRDIMTVGYEEVFGAEGGTFSETPVTIVNKSGKNYQDHAHRIDSSVLEAVDDLSKVRVMLGGEYLYHYVSGSDLYVRIPELKNGESLELTICYGNPQALDSSDKESVHEVTYGTKEMYMYNEQRYMYSLKAGTELANGKTLGETLKEILGVTLDKDEDVLIRNAGGQRFYLSYDGGVTWPWAYNIANNCLTPNGISNPLAHGGYIFCDGTLYWRASVKDSSKSFIVKSVDGGFNWTFVAQHSLPDGFISLDSYSNGVAVSTADGAGPNIDLIFPVGGSYLDDGDFANLFLMSYNGGATWTFGDTMLYVATEQTSEGGLSEATLLENEAHELVWYCRYQTNQTQTFAISVSKDYGKTWSEIEKSTVYGTNTQPTLNMVNGDPLLLWGGNNAFGGHSFNRGPLCLAVSYDGLYTFRNIQNLFTETYFEDYTQTRFGAYVTNPTMTSVGDDLLIGYYGNWPQYKVFARITDYENWFYRTKGIYDSFESQNTKYEGWVTYMGGTAISTNGYAGSSYALEILPYSVVSRSVPYLQNGTVSMNVFADGISTYTIELQSAFTPVMGKCAPVSLRVEGTKLYANDIDTELTLNQGYNTISIDLGLAKTLPTASVSINGGNAVAIDANVMVDDKRINDYVCYIAVNTGDASICLDDVLVESSLDAIPYTGEIREVELKIITQPTSQEVIIGETATFRVVAQGYGLMYQWYVSKDDGATWQIVDGATSSTYTTDSLTVGESGNETWQYKCVVMDRNENVLESDVVMRSVYGVYITIEWGSMDFLCYRDNVWKPVGEGDDQITVKNECTSEMQVSVTYTSDKGYEGVTGSFDEDDTPETASATLAPAETFGEPAEGGTVTWILKLSGDAIPDLQENTTIGGVTVHITPNNE